MASSVHRYGVLPEQADEDALHSSRLLFVEEKPFQRLAGALTNRDSALQWKPKQLPSPPPEDVNGAVEEDDDHAAKRNKFAEDILFEFAALENSIVRIQMIQSSNERERERYAREKAKILETAQAVRDNSIELRAQLAEAQRILEQRKGYDQRAAKLTNDKKLRSREVCVREIESLQKEIEDLEQESAEYETVWIGRREAFDRVVVEKEAMIRFIKGIKDEPDEADEADEEEDKDKDQEMEDGDDAVGSISKGEPSHAATPASRGETPQLDSAGAQTPLAAAKDDADAPTMKPHNKLLEIGGTAKGGSVISSPAASQAEDDIEMGEGETAEETNVATAAATPRQDVDEDMQQS